MVEKKMDKYTSHDIQNELLKIMSHYVLRGIAEQLQNLTVMIDETTDVTNQEQVTIIFRMVDNDLSVKEEFVGLYSVDSITSITL